MPPPCPTGAHQGWCPGSGKAPSALSASKRRRRLVKDRMGRRPQQRRCKRAAKRAVREGGRQGRAGCEGPNAAHARWTRDERTSAGAMRQTLYTRKRMSRIQALRWPLCEWGV